MFYRRRRFRRRLRPNKRRARRAYKIIKRAERSDKRVSIDFAGGWVTNLSTNPYLFQVQGPICGTQPGSRVGEWAVLKKLYLAQTWNIATMCTFVRLFVIRLKKQESRIVPSGLNWTTLQSSGLVPAFQGLYAPFNKDYVEVLYDTVQYRPTSGDAVQYQKDIQKQVIPIWLAMHFEDYLYTQPERNSVWVGAVCDRTDVPYVNWNMFLRSYWDL